MVVPFDVSTGGSGVHARRGHVLDEQAASLPHRDTRNEVITPRAKSGCGAAPFQFSWNLRSRWNPPSVDLDEAKARSGAARLIPVE